MRYHEKLLCPSTKCEGLSYPTHLLKSRGGVIGNNFLEYRTKQAILFACRNDIYALFATNKAKHIPNRHFSCVCSDTIYSKSNCEGSSRASSDRIIYSNEK